MNYDLLFLDVDGTLKQEPDRISNANKEAVITALSAGKKVSIATGRNKGLILNTLEELQLKDFHNTYTVALNGAHIIENCTGNTLHTVPISYNLIYLLFLKSYELDISCHVYTENLVYFNYNDSQFAWYKNRGCDCRLADMGKDDLGLEEVPLKFYLISEDTDKLKQFKREMHEATKKSLTAEYSSLYSLEYTSIHASKGLGMEYICNLYGKTLSHAVAAGDGENDISMLKMAGLGIAMKNALDSVKASADAITEHTCKEDGVTEIIQKYLLV